MLATPEITTTNVEEAAVIRLTVPRSEMRKVYSGPYEGLPSAWGEFNKWMKANGHKQAENLWEVYSVGPQSSPDPANWRTELNRPLAN